jgi:hypothetical protein
MALERFGHGAVARWMIWCSAHLDRVDRTPGCITDNPKPPVDAPPEALVERHSGLTPAPNEEEPR